MGNGEWETEEGESSSGEEGSDVDTEVENPSDTEPEVFHLSPDSTLPRIDMYPRLLRRWVCIPEHF
jgi:hypothetical protein